MSLPPGFQVSLIGRRLVEAPVALLMLAVVAGAGYSSAVRPVTLKLVLGLVLGALVIARPKVGAVMLGLTLPFSLDVAGGAVGLNVSMSDLIMPLLCIVLMGELVSGHRPDDLRHLGPVAWVICQYVATMLVVLVVHLSADQLIKTFQRFELLLIPILLGCVLVRWGLERHVLRAYVIAATLLAAAWLPLQTVLPLGQKNPVGQFIANALLLLIAVKPLRGRLLLCLPVLGFGLLSTGSRGAIVSVPVATVLLVLSHRGVGRARMALRLAPIAGLAWGLWQFLPENLQERNSTFSAGTDSSAGWALKIRETYTAEAWQMIHANPWSGVGVGGYQKGLPGGASSVDPHNVLLLQAAEGGYPLAISFVVLVVVGAGVGFRVLRDVPLGPVAVALTVAVAAHGLVDVYWVRGTPVVPWLLLGMAFGQRVIDSRGDCLATARRPSNSGRTSMVVTA